MNEVVKELRYQVGEAWKGEYSSSTEYSIAAVVQDPTGMSVYRSRKSGNVGHPLSDTAWWLCIIDLSNIKSESDAIAALNRAIAEDEAARVAAESARQTAEGARETAEGARAAAESARQTAEGARETAEGARAAAESARQTAEAARDNAESQRATNETNRQLAEAARVAAEAQREIKSAELQTKLENGTVVPALSGNIKSWEDRDDQNVPSSMTEKVRTTGGDESIKSEAGASLLSIVATEDFAASKLIASGFNLLRLQSNNGPAVALGAGFYFPVPACVFGTYGTAAQNNGVILTDNNGANLGYSSTGRPTVYFKAIADGVPTSLTDGVNLNGNAQYYHDDATHQIRFYLPPAEGYLIVSGITHADTCAHMAWSKQYNAYVSPTNVNDAGTIIDLSPLGTMRVVGSGAGMIQDRADRTDDTHMLLTTKVGRVAPVWTRGAQDPDTGLYPFTAVISGMKAGGIAEFEGAGKPALSVEGTSVTYYSESSEALADYVKYELATPTTASKSITTKVTAINDWGIDALVGASGSAIITWNYAQGIPDAVVQMLSKIDTSTVPVISEAIVALMKEIDSLKHGLDRLGNAEADSLSVRSIPKVNDAPMVLYAAGVPSASLVPVNWDKEKLGEWTGIPCFIGQVYIDITSEAAKHHYDAINTTAVSGWV